MLFKLAQSIITYRILFIKNRIHLVAEIDATVLSFKSFNNFVFHFFLDSLYLPGQTDSKRISEIRHWIFERKIHRYKSDYICTRVYACVIKTM